MLSYVIVNKDALDELRDLCAERDVLYVFPNMGETVKSLGITARSVWTVGTALEGANPHDPTPAAELVHNLEADSLSENTVVLLGRIENVLASLLAQRFDLVVIDWCDAQLFTAGLLWRAAALAPRIAVVGNGAGPRSQLTESLFKGTGYLHYGAGSLTIFTAPYVETVPYAEVY